MPRAQSATLTEAELRIMQVLWDRGSATVQQVLEALPRKKPLAYNSVLTIVRILEKKGYVRHVKDGRAHIYLALLNQREATRSEIRRLVSRFFQDSRELLVLNILEDEGLDAQELEHLRQVLDEGR
ncbi:MAG TPA: BlaI/MecI/CopY family transcriptional regulator [Terriglobales bacterium]|nr:BlaI/MecI/CopY family transcriptional regulator [Terriglobales bacterium]